MEGILLLVVAGLALWAIKSGVVSLPSSIVLPSGTAPGTVVQQSNGQYVQAVQAPNGQVVAQSISPTQAAEAQAGSIAGSVGGLAGAGASIAAAAGLSGVSAVLGVIGPIGAVAAIVIKICSLIFKGADPNQVPASKIEQVYECYADILNQLYDAGLISQNAAISCMQAAIQGAAQAEDNAPQYASDSKPFEKGIINATNVINAEIKLASSKAPVPLVKLTLAAAQAIYIGAYPTGTGQWYPGSVNLAYQLAQSTINSLISNGTQ
jgi:hypothetical protein